MSTKVTIQDIANELQLSRNTVSKAINNTGRSGRCHTGEDPAQGCRNGIQAIFLPSGI